MAVLSDNDRRDCWAEFMRDRDSIAGLSITKQELRAAFDAVDEWLNTNASALNSAIPQPARGALSTTQKAKLLIAVVTKRFLAGA